jgi:hypothetical protein
MAILGENDVLTHDIRGGHFRTRPNAWGHHGYRVVQALGIQYPINLWQVSLEKDRIISRYDLWIVPYVPTLFTAPILQTPCLLFHG